MKQKTKNVDRETWNYLHVHHWEDEYVVEYCSTEAELKDWEKQVNTKINENFFFLSKKK